MPLLTEYVGADICAQSCSQRGDTKLGHSSPTLAYARLQRVILELAARGFLEVYAGEFGNAASLLARVTSLAVT